MNILIDGRPFVASNAGISTFLKGSLTAWAKRCQKDMFYVALPGPLHSSFDKRDWVENIKLITSGNRILQKLPHLIWLEIMMPILAKKYQADVYYSPLPCLPFYLPPKTKRIVVVHDVVNIEYPETMQWTNVLANKLFYKRSIKKADYIWTNSLYTKQKVEHYFPQRRCKEIFTGCSVNRSLYQPIPIQENEAEAIKKKLGIVGHFILFVGSLEPRKNLQFLLSLMPEVYKRTGRQLVVVGAKGWKNSGIREIVESNDFPRQSTVFCGYVSNEELARLYNMADCFVSASLNEGFGMPQLEALLCGCPIVTAHNSAMVEVAHGKKGAITVQGYDARVWTEQICEVCTNRPSVDISQFASYDWDSILEAFLQYLSSK